MSFCAVVGYVEEDDCRTSQSRNLKPHVQLSNVRQTNSRGAHTVLCTHTHAHTDRLLDNVKRYYHFLTVTLNTYGTV